jgi:SAM-dependent methyltransferase
MTDTEQIKACCATTYGTDAVALVLGEAYHPGGLALTRHLASTLGLRAGDRVADIAAGPGTTARLLAAEHGVTVAGVDLDESTVERARAAAERAGLSAQVRFHLGDAERLPLPDNAFDAVVCECAFCTFPDKATAAAEFARVLRPGGRVGITERHDGALTAMIDQIEARVTALRMLQPERLRAAGVDVGTVLRYVDLARRAAADGVLGYALMIAEKAGHHRE